MGRKEVFKLKEGSLRISEGTIVLGGKLGWVKRAFRGQDIILKDESVLVKSKMNSKTFQSLLMTMGRGVSTGFFIILSLKGLGYRLVLLKRELLLKLGYSNYWIIWRLKFLKVLGYRNKLILFGLNLEEVRKVGNLFKKLKKVDRYKGKGIVYLGEKIVLKTGKQR